MQTHCALFDRRHHIPSTVGILNELRSGFVPGYARKSLVQFGFVTSVETAEGPSRGRSCHKEPSL